MAKVYIMRGQSGSGKSTYAQTLVADGGVILSSDNFFMNDKGEYRFDASQLGAAHSWNLRSFIELVRHGPYECPRGMVVVIDNTNTTIAELSPYYTIANAYGCDPEIITLDTVTPEESFKRNVHKVPMEAIVRQHN